MRGKSGVTLLPIFILFNLVRENVGGGIKKPKPIFYTQMSGVVRNNYDGRERTTSLSGEAVNPTFYNQKWKT